jgi:hypothetical protein
MPQTITLERPTYRFTIPEKARTFKTDPATFAMRPITAGEERRANEVAEGAKVPLAYELVRVAVCEVDGRPVSWDGREGSVSPEWFDACSPKVRQLVMEAFASLNRPSEEDTAAFLASQTIEVAG